METWFENQPHRRYNPLTGEWVLVSPQRAKRPWQGRVEALPEEKRPSYDPNCYLCPGNSRAGGKKNPMYKGVYVFDNDFSALLPDTPVREYRQSNLLHARGEPGICRVVCLSPRHDLTLPELSLPEVRAVVDVWVEQYQELGALPEIHYVQIFENKGEMMGCSNPHPHGQIWAQRSLPVEPEKEQRQQEKYLRNQKRCLLCDYLELEEQLGERVVLKNDSFIVVVPFWAVWPFETLVISRRHRANLAELTPLERTELAEVLQKITIRYDNLFQVSFPYSAGFHQAPTDGKEHPEWHLHFHFYPPLLRSATIRKFMVGYEMLANPQRDITPEWSAARLKEMSDIHYKRNK